MYNLLLFFQSNLNIFWMIIAIIAIVFEIFTITFYVGFYSIGALLAIVLQSFGYSLMLQTIVFFLVPNIFFLIFLFYRDKLGISHKTFTRTNLDSVIGKEGLVGHAPTWINNGATVKIEGKEWTAIEVNGQKLALGQRVKVLRLEGVKLIVEVLN